MGTPATRRTLSIRLYRRKKKVKRFGPLDVAAAIAIVTLILCEVTFPLADKDFGDQASGPLVNLKLLSVPAQDAMSQFNKARIDFYQNSKGHPRDIGLFGADIYQLLGMELQYLSYYHVASAVLIDELSRVEKVESNPTNAEKSNSQLIADLTAIEALQPKLNKCVERVAAQQKAIGTALQAGPSEATKTSLMISTLNSIPDLIRDKTAHWFQCQSELVEFDSRLASVTHLYPAVIQQLDTRSEWQKRIRTVLRWLSGLVLFYCGQVYRRRWMKAASSTLAGS